MARSYLGGGWGIKPRPRPADDRCVLRTFTVVLTVVALAASGVTLYSHLRRDGVKGVLQAFDFGKSGLQAASNDLVRAANELERARELAQTYTAVDVSRLGEVELAFASPRGFCIQVQKADRWYHLAGPRGTPEDGAC